MRILSNHSFPGDDAHDILCFSGKFHDYYYYDSQKPSFFPDILKTMPAGWEPDVVLFKSPLYFAVPYGIEDCPYPTVLLLDDWFGGVDYLPDIFAKFDYIFTDKTSVAMLMSLGFSNVGYWPLFGFSPALFRLLPGEERVYDVTFTGNFNVNVQGKRLRWLRRLAELDKKYSVRLFHQAWHEEYVKILNRSRIVFNHSIKGEMNQRAFEAPACGAMLCMEEGNLEVRDFFTPGKECVLYNENNFEEVLAYYLTHGEKRAEIAKQGYERAQDFSAPRLFDGLVDKIESLRMKAGQGRSARRLYACLPQHRDYVQASLAKFGRGESTVKNTELLVSIPGADSLLLNDCAVILMSYADDIKSTLGAPTHGALASNALTLLLHAAARTPGHLTPEFNRAQILFASGKKQEAMEIYKRLFASRVPDSYESCKGLVYPLHYGYPLRYAWNMAIAGTLPDSRAMAQARHRLIRFFCAANLAALAPGTENPSGDEAMDWYEKAHSLFPDDSYAVLPLAGLYLKKENHPRTRELCAAALSANPFCIDFWKEWALYLIKCQSIDEARQFIDSCLLCLGRLQMATPEMIKEFEILKKELDETV
jgi:tetratricopeptide (TPR) repeat protein